MHIENSPSHCYTSLAPSSCAGLRAPQQNENVLLLELWRDSFQATKSIDSASKDTYRGLYGTLITNVLSLWLFAISIKTFFQTYAHVHRSPQNTDPLYLLGLSWNSRRLFQEVGSRHEKTWWARAESWKHISPSRRAYKNTRIAESVDQTVT